MTIGPVTFLLTLRTLLLSERTYKNFSAVLQYRLLEKPCPEIAAATPALPASHPCSGCMPDARSNIKLRQYSPREYGRDSGTYRVNCFAAEPASLRAIGG